jgi:hypothetical protein
LSPFSKGRIVKGGAILSADIIIFFYIVNFQHYYRI